MGRDPRTKETLPDFLKWRRVTRHPLVFRGLTGSQRTPGFWGVTARGREQQVGAVGARHWGARGAGAARSRGARAAQVLGERPGRAGWPGLCTWCTRPVFGPV